jgi:hypothetical protein
MITAKDNGIIFPVQLLFLYAPVFPGSGIHDERAKIFLPNSIGRQRRSMEQGLNCSREGEPPDGGQ